MACLSVGETRIVMDWLEGRDEKILDAVPDAYMQWDVNEAGKCEWVFECGLAFFILHIGGVDRTEKSPRREEETREDVFFDKTFGCGRIKNTDIHVQQKGTYLHKT